MARVLVNADSAAGFGKASPRTIDELLRHAAWCRPTAPAVRDAVETMTHCELDEAAEDCAAWLTHNGVRSGDRVVVRAPNSASLAALILGIARAGGIAVPVSPEMSDYQVAAVIEHAEPMIVVGHADGCAVLRTLTTASVVSADEIRQFTPIAELPRRAPDPDDLFLLIYTSGSTAAPTGVMTTHRQAMFAVRSLASRLRYGTVDAVFCQIPMSFDYGLYQLFLCLYSGAQLLIPQTDTDAALLDLIRSWNATVVPIVPSLGSTLAELAHQDPRPTSVRLFTNSGAALAPESAAALRAGFPTSQLCLMFGITECKQVSITEPDGDLTRPGSVGKPIDGTRVRVVDEEGRDLPAGQVGEFVVHGPHVMSGYWRAAELTAVRFRGQAGTSTRRLHTGDFGWLDDEGYLYVVDRFVGRARGAS